MTMCQGTGLLAHFVPGGRGCWHTLGTMLLVSGHKYIGLKKVPVAAVDISAVTGTVFINVSLCVYAVICTFNIFLRKDRKKYQSADYKQQCDA